MIGWEALGEKLDQALAEKKPIVLATHVNADGDGLGSEIALWSFLKERGHDVSMINDDPVPRKYRFLKGSEEVLVYDKDRSRKLIHDAGLFIVLDNSSPERLGRLLPDLKESDAFTICIDHHAEVDPFWNLNCVDNDASASGQLVYGAIRALGGTINAAMAEALYVSFVTDTGHFRFSKTTSEVHRIIADLMEKGSISPPRIYRALFEDIPRGFNKLIAYALADAHYESDGRLAWARLTGKQLAECDAYEQDTGDLVNMLLSVDRVEAAALFKELPDGGAKISFRSRGDVDVNNVASKFGGGGHKNASGAVIQGSFDEGVKDVVAGLKEALGKP